ncbi:vWA domain-containing protein [Actinophytocola sp.]|uniref:vWA domain-containing protein n=1 Tax=Actinophytocola sp. TaxID=1872138 RepID=UPI002D4DA098|nr:VWA domain-containing protein [Actinophytocola sp.]HYQ69834.1 VWA domain-containing protein [Actinophytocola sp.]
MIGFQNVSVEGQPSTHRVWQFYIVCDVSRSMWNAEEWPDEKASPLYIMNESLGLMLETLADDIEASAIGRVAVITFGDNATTHYPLTQIDKPHRLDPLPKGNWTDYAAVWEHLNDTVRTDVTELQSKQYLPKQPVIFFITDGNAIVQGRPQPIEKWSAARDKLCSPDFAARPRVVALGMGAVDRAVVRALRSVDPPGAAYLANPGEPASTLLDAIIKVIIVSITRSAARNAFTFPTPVGMTRLDGDGR